jgi:hypothetical protein
LSFTGYANGAWLAEHAIYYAHSKFKHKKTKAVLFESPGMCKSEEEWEKTGIISRDHKFSLKDLNVVNYLTAPCFANSCNQHVGKVYRLFVDESALEKKVVELVNKVENVRAIGFIIKNLFTKPTKGYKFFLIGLLTMFSEEKLDLIIKAFNATTGKPNYCEEVSVWPVVELSFDNRFGKDFKKNLSKLTEKTFKEIVGIVPVGPDFIKKPIGCVLGKMTAFGVNLFVKKMMSGTFMFINLLIELGKMRINNMDQFEDSRFYVKIGI